MVIASEAKQSPARVLSGRWLEVASSPTAPRNDGEGAYGHPFRNPLNRNSSLVDLFALHRYVRRAFLFLAPRACGGWRIHLPGAVAGQPLWAHRTAPSPPPPR